MGTVTHISTMKKLLYVSLMALAFIFMIQGFDAAPLTDETIDLEMLTNWMQPLTGSNHANSNAFLPFPSSYPSKRYNYYGYGTPRLSRRSSLDIEQRPRRYSVRLTR